MVPSGRSAMICSAAAMVAAHQPQAHDVVARRLGHGVEQLQQPQVFGGLAAQAWPSDQQKSGRSFRTAARKRHPAPTDDVGPNIGRRGAVVSPDVERRRGGAKPGVPRRCDAQASHTIQRVGTSSPRERQGHGLDTPGVEEAGLDQHGARRRVVGEVAAVTQRRPQPSRAHASTAAERSRSRSRDPSRAGRASSRPPAPSTPSGSKPDASRSAPRPAARSRTSPRASGSASPAWRTNASASASV